MKYLVGNKNWKGKGTPLAVVYPTCSNEELLLVIKKKKKRKGKGTSWKEIRYMNN